MLLVIYLIPKSFYNIKILDAAFGKCIRLFNAIDDNTYRYDLDPAELALLREQLEKLVDDKYNWLHPYTQCVMQNALNSIKFNLKHDEKFCLDFKNTVNGETTDFIDIENDDEVKNIIKKK